MDANNGHGLVDWAATCRKIDQHISVWRWSVALALAIPSVGTIGALAGIQRSGASGGTFAGAIGYSVVFGAVMGALGALAARSIVKAIRC